MWRTQQPIYSRIINNILSLVKNWKEGLITDKAIVEAYHAAYEDTDITMLYSHIRHLIEEQRLVKEGAIISLPPIQAKNEFTITEAPTIG